MQFLKHDTYTDTITFPFSAKGKPILSDIYISVDRVRENAELFGRPFLEELYRVIFHGSLHLTGFRDKTLSQKKAMTDRENFYLTKYVVPRKTVSDGNSRK